MGGGGVKMAIFSVTYFLNDPLPRKLLFLMKRLLEWNELLLPKWWLQSPAPWLIFFLQINKNNYLKKQILNIFLWTLAVRKDAESPSATHNFFFFIYKLDTHTEDSGSHTHNSVLKIYQLLLSTKTRSGLRGSPVIKYRDGKEGRSAYNEAFLIDDIDLARYERTE